MANDYREESTRIAATEAVLELMDSREDVALVSTDSLLVIKGQPIQARYPDRVVELGIAEQNGVDVSAGMAASGMCPFLATYAGFITMRACEQVRTFVAYPGLNVKLIGANGGIASGEREGPTHQFFEDLGILRTMPGMTIMVPADAGQVRQAVRAAAEMDGPVYIRIGSGRDPVVFPEPPPFEAGKGRLLLDYGKDAAILACGPLLLRALEAAEILREEGILIRVGEIHTIKPLDREFVAGMARETGALVTVEDHNIIGGLGSAVAEVLGEMCPVPLERIGIRDVFTRSGKPEELLDYYAMGVGDMARAVRLAVGRKKTIEEKR